MDFGSDRFTPREGMTVYGSDGDKVGEIDAIEQDHVIVRKGFFFPEDHYIPLDAVDSYDDEAIYLRYTKDQVLEQGWTAAPAASGTTTATDGGTGLEHDSEPFLHDQDTQRTHVHEDDQLRVDVHEEELVANRRQVDRGDVVINKQVVEEEQAIDVPVTEERVEVTRRAVSGDVTADEHAFEEGTIAVPVRGEEVDVQKRARVTEEIDIDKVAETHTERVGDTVRREEVVVDGETIDGRGTPRR